jgi:hypothetical protein
MDETVKLWRNNIPRNSREMEIILGKKNPTFQNKTK